MGYRYVYVSRCSLHVFVHISCTGANAYYIHDHTYMYVCVMCIQASSHNLQRSQAKSNVCFKIA